MLGGWAARCNASGLPQGARHRPCSLRRGVRRTLSRLRGGPSSVPRQNAEGTERREALPSVRALRGAERVFAIDALRLAALHRGSRRWPLSLRLSSRPPFLGRGLGRCYLPSACPSPARISRSGHNAARAGPRSRPGAGVRTPPAGAAPCSIIETSRDDALSRARPRTR
jgi:hypothetical protein